MIFCGIFFFHPSLVTDIRRYCQKRIKPSVRWVKSDNSPVEMPQGMTVDNLHVSQEFIKVVLNGHALTDVSTLAFQDPATFITGSIHSHFSAWEQISKVGQYELTPEIRWIKNLIDIQQFFQPFKGQY